MKVSIKSIRRFILKESSQPAIVELTDSIVRKVQEFAERVLTTAEHDDDEALRALLMRINDMVDRAAMHTAINSPSARWESER